MEKEKQQSVVEWYEKEVNALIDKYEAKEISKSEFIVMKHNLFYPAKRMEKQIIAQAFEDGEYNYFYSKKTGEEFENGIEYYNETFKSE